MPPKKKSSNPDDEAPAAGSKTPTSKKATKMTADAKGKATTIKDKAATSTSTSKKATTMAAEAKGKATASNAKATPKTKNEVSSSSTSLIMAWDLVDMVTEMLFTVPTWAVANAVRLLDKEGCSIPFVARYRKEQTGNMEADKVREVVAAIETLK